jgi:sugar phosphate isomerase/epimerase
VHPRVSVSAISTMSWDLERDLEFYRQAGITNVGLSLRKLEAFGVAESAKRVADAGLNVTNVLGLGFDLTDRTRWAKHQDRMAAAVQAAAAVDAGCVALTTGTAGSMPWEDAAGALAEALAPVLAVARQCSMPVAIEHTNSLRADVGFVHTLRDVVDLAGKLSVGVVMECNACWAERDLGGTVAAAAGSGDLRLVQVSDYVIGTTTTPDRVVPGDGDLPLPRIIGQVLAAGYLGVFDLELIGPRIEAEGYEGAVRRSIDWLGSLLQGLGA